MKTHIYILNESSRNSNCGIGTYVHQLIECFKNDKFFSLNIVLFRSDKDEFTISQEQSVSYIHIPIVSALNTEEACERYYRNAAYLLADYIQIPTSDRLIFHFNRLFNNFHKTLKKKFPECRTVCTLHLDPISYSYKRKLRLTKQMLNQLQGAQSVQAKGKQMFDGVDHIICLSTYMQEVLIDCCKIPAERVSLVYNGIKDKIISLSGEERRKLRRQYFIPDDEKLMLFVGRLERIKGIEELIKAFQKVVVEIPNSTLVIAGDGDYSEYFRLCEGFWAKIVFTGMLDKEWLYMLYQMADIGVMPSFYEECSFVAIEMMMHGLPFIGTSAPGLDEMIVNAEDKVQIEYQGVEAYISPDTLAGCIIQKLKNTVTLDCRTSRPGKYTLNNMYNNTKAVYNLF